MQMPGCEFAFVEIVKLRDYVLNPNHEHGKNKAYVFASVFGMTMDDADELQELLLSIACEDAAVLAKKDDYGQRYALDFEFQRGGRRGVIRSAWIIRSDEDFPRLTSCYVL